MFVEQLSPLRSWGWDFPSYPFCQASAQSGHGQHHMEVTQGRAEPALQPVHPEAPGRRGVAAGVGGGALGTLCFLSLPSVTKSQCDRVSASRGKPLWSVAGG